MFGDFHATTLLKREDSKGGGGTTEGTTNIPPGQTKAGDKRGKKEAEAPRLWAVFGGIPPERRGGRAPKNPFHRGGGGKEKSGAICTVSSFFGGRRRSWGNEKRVERKRRRDGGRRLAPCEGWEGRSKEKLLLRGGSCLQRHKALPSGWKERGGQKKKKTKKKVAPPSPLLPFCPLPFFRFIVFSLTTQAERRKAGRKRKEKEEVFVFPVPAGRRGGGSGSAGGRGERREVEDGEDTKYLRSGNYVAGVKRAQSLSFSGKARKCRLILLLPSQSTVCSVYCSWDEVG